MDLAESGLFWKVLNKRERRGDSQRISSVPIVWESCKVTAPPCLAIAHWERNFQWFTQVWLRFFLPQTMICKGGMKKFGICSQWRCETFLIIIILLSMFWAFGTCSRGVSPELVRGNGVRCVIAEDETISKCTLRLSQSPDAFSCYPGNWFRNCQPRNKEALKNLKTGWGTGKISWKSLLLSI